MHSFIKSILLLSLFIFQSGSLISKAVDIESNSSVRGDYFNGSGHHLGSDGVDDGKIYIAKSLKSIAIKRALRDKTEAGIVFARNNSFEIPDALVFNECLDVLHRARGNGGFREEVSLVLGNKKIVRGKTGPPPRFTDEGFIAETSIPAIPKRDFNEKVLALIHSHPLRINVRGSRAYFHSALELSKKDIMAFNNFKVNIVVGPLGKASFDPISGEIVPKPLGIVIYYGNSDSKVHLTFHSMRKIIATLDEKGSP